MRCRLRAGVALVVLGLMWGVLFLVPFAAPWIGFGVLGLPCTATLGGFLDRRTMRQAADTLVEVAFLLLRSELPPNLRIWTTIAAGTSSTVQRLQPSTLLADVARMMAPAISFDLLVQDRPTAASRYPDRELSASLEFT